MNNLRYLTLKWPWHLTFNWIWPGIWLEVTLSFAHPMSVPFTLQQPCLPVPFIPLTTPCYPIPRRTTPFAGTFVLLPCPKNHTLCPYPRTIWPNPVTHSKRTTPFAGTLYPSDHTYYHILEKNHTLCWYPTSYYPIPRTMPFAGYPESLLPYPLPHLQKKSHPLVGTLHHYYPIPERTTPCDSTLLPITLHITHQQMNHTLWQYPESLKPPRYPIPTRTAPFAGALHPYYPHPKKNHTLCRHPSSIWPHHFTHLHNNHTLWQTLHPYYPIPRQTTPLLVPFISITLSSEEPHPLTVPFIPITLPITIYTRTTPFNCTLHLYYPISRRTTPFAGTLHPSYKL